LGTTKTNAEALFKKETRIREGEKSMADYLAERQAVRDKTARLRALRLAHEARASRASATATASKHFEGLSRQSEECERIADAAADPDAKNRYKRSARTWRNIAQAASK
jgi:hypothetical protein